MSLQTFLHMQTNTFPGELKIINPDERRHDGYFELGHISNKQAPKLKLYFAYDAVIDPSMLADDTLTQAMFDELVTFYNALQDFGSFKPYVLCGIHLARGQPFVIHNVG